MSTSSDTIDLVLPARPAGWERPPLLSAGVRVDLGALSHPGKVRPNNEDHFFVARFGRFLEQLFTNLPGNEMPRRLEDAGYGMVVADGIGGSAAGEVASKLAITTLLDLALGTPDWILRLEDDLLHQEVKRRTGERFDAISTVMAEAAQSDPALSGFGTTMTLALSLAKNLLVAHIGDSRAYLLRQQGLYQLTHDHTLAQALADLGLLAQPQVATHRLRHALTKSLGAQGGKVEPDVQEVVLADGDCLLLCTDGLTEMVKDEAIARILGSGGPAEKTCQYLVEAALEAGGKDNVSVIVARYLFPAAS